jgi:hypothetical protein
VRPPRQRHLRDSLIRPFVYQYPSRICQKIAPAKRCAQRRDLLGRDTMFVCYSSQE